MVYQPKVEPPLDEIEIEDRRPRGDRPIKPHLIISLECLEHILDRENAVILPSDVPRLMATICQYTLDADISDTNQVRRLKADYDKEIDDDE